MDHPAEIEEYNQLYQACNIGNIQEAQQILQNNPILNAYLDQDLTISICCAGHLNILQWLISIRPNIEINHNEFIYACINGHFELALWLLQTYPDIDISAKNDYAFTWSCASGKIQIVKWLLEINPNIKNNVKANQIAFYWSCYFGNYDIVEFLLENSNIDIFAENHVSFINACKKKHLNIAHLLQKKSNLYVINYGVNGEYVGYYIRTKEEANWEKRKYLVWLASKYCPDTNKKSILYKMPNDVSRYLIEFV
jgi:ankyrin repeat protein